MICGIDLAKNKDSTVYLSLNEAGKQYAEKLFMSGKTVAEVKKIILANSEKYINISSAPSD